MKPTLKIICFALMLFVAPLVSTAQNADSTNQDTNFQGLQLVKKKKSLLIPLGEAVVIYTATTKYKGILNDVNDNTVFIGNDSVKTAEIVQLKYVPSARKKVGKGFLISSGVSFIGAIAFSIWYLGPGAQWTSDMSYVTLIYTPIGVITGLILIDKKTFNINQGWNINTIH